MKKIGAAILSVTLLTVPSAYALTMSGFSGHAMTAADGACFSQSVSGGVKNTCNSSRNWIIPLTNTRTSTGSVTVKATANGSCGAPGTVCLATAPLCTVWHIDAFGVQVQSATKTLSANTNTTTTVGTLNNVTSTGTLFMTCSIPGTDKAAPLALMSVSW
jgi:hypothetical protein